MANRHSPQMGGGSSGKTKLKYANQKSYSKKPAKMRMNATPLYIPLEEKVAKYPKLKKMSKIKRAAGPSTGGYSTYKSKK